MGNKTYYIVIFIALLVLSCNEKNSEDHDNSEYQSSLSSEMLKPIDSLQNIGDWEKFENKILTTIDSIENCKPDRLKKHLTNYLKYNSKVDGAIAELYYAFAFDFVDQNPTFFFSVLKAEDKEIINKWAKLSANEVNLILFNIGDPDDYLKKIQTDFQTKTNSLAGEKLKLSSYYMSILLENLEQN